MKEKLIHKKAFNYYFLLGNLVPIKSKKDMREKSDIKRGSKLDNIMKSIAGKRSLLKVAMKFNVSRTAVNNWYKAFDWEQRVREKDREINRQVNERISQQGK